MASEPWVGSKCKERAIFSILNTIKYFKDLNRVNPYPIILQSH